MSGVEQTQLPHNRRHQLLFAAQLISQREHNKRRVIAESFQDTLAFRQTEVIVVWFAEVGPVRQFRLHINARLVRCLERRLGRTPGMKTIMIYAV